MIVSPISIHKHCVFGIGITKVVLFQRTDYREVAICTSQPSLLIKFGCSLNLHCHPLSLPQLKYKAETDKARLFKFCLSVAHEEEFFIRKAIGWALREYSKTNSTAVSEFVEEYRESLSNLSVREALKYC